MRSLKCVADFEFRTPFAPPALAAPFFAIVEWMGLGEVESWLSRNGIRVTERSGSWNVQKVFNWVGGRDDASRGGRGWQNMVHEMVRDAIRWRVPGHQRL